MDTYVVIGNDREKNTLYAGQDEEIAITTYKEAIGSVYYIDTWIEIWNNGVCTNHEWRPIV